MATPTRQSLVGGNKPTSTNKSDSITANRSPRLSAGDPRLLGVPSPQPQKESISPRRTIPADILQPTPEERSTYEALRKLKGSAQKSIASEDNKTPVNKQMATLLKPRTPGTESNEFSFNRTPGSRSRKSPSDNRDGSSGSKGKVRFSDTKSYQSPHSRNNSEGKHSTKSDIVHSRGKDSKGHQALERALEEGNASIEFLGRNELEKPENDDQNQHPHQEEEGTSGSERKEYTLLEDWRILESIEHYKSATGSDKGVSSLSFWEKLIDPKTNKRILEGARTAESLRDHYRRTLVNLTKQDLEIIKRFVQDHPEEHLSGFFCQYKRDGKNKRFTGIARSTYFSSNLRRKTPYNQPGHKETKESHQPQKKTKAEQTGRIEAGFSRPEEEEISNFTQTQSIRASLSRNQLQPEPQPQHVTRVYHEPQQFTKATSSGLKLPKPVDLSQFSFVQGTTRQIREIRPQRIYDGESIRVEERKIPEPIRGLNKPQRRKEYEAERLITRDIGEIKKIRHIKEYEGKSLIVTEAFKLKAEGPEPWSYDENLSVYVDKTRRIRFCKKEVPQVDTQKEREIKRLVQLGKEYDIVFEHLMELFGAVSHDCDTLELYLKTRRPELLWNADEDNDLLTNNQTALRYLRNAKGEESVIRRRDYLKTLGY